MGNPFHCKICNYSHADLNSLCGHFGRCFLKQDIFEFGASATSTDFVSWSRLELMYISLIINQFNPNLHL